MAKTRTPFVRFRDSGAGSPVNAVAARVMSPSKSRTTSAELRGKAKKAKSESARARLLAQAAELQQKEQEREKRMVSPASVKRAVAALERAQWERENSRR